MTAAASSSKRLKTSAKLVNWADLPEFLQAIAERIGVYEDFTAFRGVCKFWRSATAESKFNPSPDQLPWLMLAEEVQDSQPYVHSDDDDWDKYNYDIGKSKDTAWNLDFDWDEYNCDDDDDEDDDDDDEEDDEVEEDDDDDDDDDGDEEEEDDDDDEDNGDEEEEDDDDDEDNGDEEDCVDYNSRKFFSLCKKGMIRRVDLPEARFKHCTSSLGWLITTDEEGNADLLHPLTRDRIPLPSLRSFKYYHRIDYFPDRLYMKRATLSASPSFTKDYVLMVILGNEYRLAFWKPGDKIWNVIEESCPNYRDVIYYKDQFVTVDYMGRVRVCNINPPNLEPHNNVLGRISDDDDVFYQRVYLVESAGRLLALTRHTEHKNEDKINSTQWTTHFRVYEFSGCRRWKEITSNNNCLEGRSVFIGHNTSFSCNADEAAMAIEPNCIYFTDDCSYEYNIDPGSKDMGVYRLEDRLFDEYYQGDQWCSRYCTPLWVMPSF